MKKNKYQFTDKYGNQHSFANYLEFAKFWFNLPYAFAVQAFPDYNKLNRIALYSKESKQKI